VGARLAAISGDGEPTDLVQAVWAVCAQDPSLFTEPTPPLSEIIDGHGLTRSEGWLGGTGFSFDRWAMERKVTALAKRRNLGPDTAFAMLTLLKVYEKCALVLDGAAEADGADGAFDTAARPGAAGPAAGQLADLAGELGDVLADPHLAEKFLMETIGASHTGAPADGSAAAVPVPAEP
jgi:hypothetical protein